MLVLYLISCLAVGTLSQSSSGPIVDTPLGRVQGWERLSRDGRLYQAWTSIPYAQPPVGKLRFQAPKPPKKWSGILNATRDTPLCLQNLGGNVRGSEDCLYLNVYRPKNHRENMPVLFRVHGGAFQVGNIGPRENADYLMDEDLVLVQIHYRMNAIGFASLGNKLMPGNYGIKDQVMALKWVQQNIASFGGNPKSVTVYGESAGAASVHILLKAPATEGMVHRAIADSGTVNHIWSQVKTDIVKNGTLQLAAKIGCPISGDDLEIFNCLQGVSSETLVSALPEGMAGVDSYVPCFEPKDAEDAVMTEDLSMLPSNKPFITSNCNGEFLIPYSSLNPQVITYAHENLDSYLEEYITKYLDVPNPSRSREGAAILKKSYFPTMEPLQNFTLELANVGGDITFIYPALYNLVYHQGPKWYYYLTYIGELSKAASRAWVRIGDIPDVAAHADQRLYYFNYRSEYGFGPKDTPEDYQVSKRMIKYLVNFAYYDDPTPAGTPFKWDQYGEGQILRIANSRSDSMGDQSFLQSFQNILNMWSYVIGW